jgi:hypothetical protein
MPELYPGPALWARDIPAFLAAVPPSLRAPLSIGNGMLLQPYVTQLEMDERYALLTAAYAAMPGGAAAARTYREHAAAFAASGLALQVRDPGAGAPPLSGRDIFHARGGYAVDWRVALREAAPRPCDKCQAPLAAARCRCGEAYCSRECQAADWGDHKQICDVLEDNFSLALFCTSLWWATQGVGAPRRGSG